MGILVVSEVWTECPRYAQGVPLPKLHKPFNTLPDQQETAVSAHEADSEDFRERDAENKQKQQI